MDIYSDIEKRTNGEIYIGVVGPVRTGKSTFIKNFMEKFVLPTINNKSEYKQAADELPQSASGSMIMTTEPKFVPKEAAQITITENVKAKVRLIDCVGYMIDNASGYMEDGKERMVRTPWYDYDIPFSKAAEIGTQKVIYDHSTIGIVIITDGSITGIDRAAYVNAEEKCINELKSLNKPFVVLLNSVAPDIEETKKLAEELSDKYKVSLLPFNCENFDEKDILDLFQNILLNFPISSINFNIPKWLEAQELDDKIKQNLISVSSGILKSIISMKDAYDISINDNPYIENIEINNIDMSDGSVYITINIFDKYYYEMLSGLFNCEINNEYDFIREIKELSNTKEKCLRVSSALLQAHKTGYGSVTPEEGEILLDEPELIKSGNKYGVKIKANAPSIHLIKANISTEIAPIVGSEEQAVDLIKYIKSDGVSDKNIWAVNIFGKTIKQLVEDGLKSKINKINQESQQKLQDTMEKIVNDSNGGMVCIII